MQRVGFHAVPHDRTMCIQLSFQGTSFAIDFSDYEAVPSVEWLFPKQKVGEGHAVSRDTAYFVAVHEVSSDGPAVVLLVLELVGRIDTKAFLHHHMRHILGFHMRFQVNRHLSSEHVAET